MAETLHNAPIVLDNGSGTIRAGFAGEDTPKCFFPSFVGRPKHTRVLAGALEGDVFIGRKAEEYRGLLKIRYPLEHGIVTDWDDMERIWQHVYSEELKTMSEEVCTAYLVASITRFALFSLTDGFPDDLTASSITYRSPPESSFQPRHRCSNPV